ncbi:hypothetical protein ON010_g4596 [Phytophthora cinnamomi]|nr:hypothetical protein ON010_g4596 [Phytophthora cinnamomi]
MNKKFTTFHPAASGKPRPRPPSKRMALHGKGSQFWTPRHPERVGGSIVDAGVPANQVARGNMHRQTQDCAMARIHAVSTPRALLCCGLRRGARIGVYDGIRGSPGVVKTCGARVLERLRSALSHDAAPGSNPPTRRPHLTIGDAAPSSRVRYLPDKKANMPARLCAGRAHSPSCRQDHSANFHSDAESFVATVTHGTSTLVVEIPAMSHRFPIQEKVFPPLQLSDSAREKLVNTALMQLSRALRDYDKYQKWQASRPPSLRYQLHPAMWKPVKTCEQLTVYRRVPADDAVVTAPSGGTRRRARSRTLEAMRLPRGTDSDSVSSAPKDSNNDAWPFPNRGSNPTGNSEWNMPTLLQVGSIEGTLDDVMYGTATFDGTGTLIKSSYTAEEVVDADTLYEIQGPTANDPFRFLGLKWVVKATSPAVKAFVWPRDLTFIAATGVLNREGGERVGYHMMHSVDLGKGFGPLEGKRIVRGRVSSCFLARKRGAAIGGEQPHVLLESGTVRPEQEAVVAASSPENR